MTKDFIKYLVIGDVHLGHPLNKTKFITDNLLEFLQTYIIDIDVLFIAGDWTDRLLNIASEYTPDIIYCINSIINLCKKYNVKLRILEGTPSHDWKQSILFPIINSVKNESIDLKYIDTLHIENISDFDINVLYVPDEWNRNSEDTYKEVLAIMKSKGLNTVDIAIMHGQFTYQLPGVITPVSHNPDNYLNIVKYFINIAHVHTYTVYDRIIAQGSFDRVAHGEEKPKGGCLMTIFKNGLMEHIFLENTKARKFVTINIKDFTVEESLDKIDKKLNKLPDNSFIRIKAKKNNPLLKQIKELKLKHLMFHFTTPLVDDKDTTLDESKLVDDKFIFDSNYIPITINKDNIKTLIDNEISKNNYTAELFNLIEEELRGVI